MVSPFHNREESLLAHRVRVWPCSKGVLCSLWLLALTPLSPAAQTLPAGVSQAPIPGWVELVEPVPVASLPAPDAGTAVDYLLVDQQTRVANGSVVEYRHLALRALNTQGLEQAANLQIEVNPEFQQLRLHRLQVRRGGQIIPQFGRAQTRLLQRERDLENLVIHGTQTLHIVLDDVRVGDVIEYSYSRRGRNPALRGYASGQFSLQSSVPVHQLRARLLWPSERALHWRHHNQAPRGTLSRSPGQDEYRWDLAAVAARQVEADAPVWWNPYPSVQWGEHADWQSVAAWATPLYAVAAPFDPAVQKVVDRISADHADPEQQVIAALRWVQSEVRYLAVALGSGSYVPSPPGSVLKRRYGDCKDKTLLGLSLLKGLGIEAHAALVNTRLRRNIDQYLPDPGAFDHVVLRVRLGDRIYWVDPTRLPQAGQRLSDWVQADFQLALVVEGKSTALEAMPAPSTALRRFNTIVDSSAGFDKPAVLTVSTELAGQSAEDLRAAFATRGRDELQKAYLNYYSRSYSNLSIAAPMEIADDRAANHLRVVEHYSVERLWQQPAAKQRHEAAIGSPELDELLRTPGSITRESPLSLRHPILVEAVTEVRLPDDWHVSGTGIEVRDAAFEVTREEQLNGRTLLWKDRYISLADHVAAADVGRYAANLERARQGLNIVLSKGMGGSSGGPHWAPLLVGLLTVLGLVWLVRRLYLWDPEPRPLPPGLGDKAPVGIGGWLLIPVLGLPLGVFVLVKALYESLPVYDADFWRAVVEGGTSGYQPYLGPFLLLGLAATLAHLALTGLTMVLLTRRRTSFPSVYIWVHIFGIGVIAIDCVTTFLLPSLEDAEITKEIALAVRGIIVTLIWVTYMARSNRVGATFVRRLADVSPPVVAPAGAGTDTR